MRARLIERIGALAAAAVALAPGGAGWPRAVLLAAAFGVLPGWMVARRLLPGRSTAFHASLGITVSPLLTAGPAALLVSSGWSLAAATRAVAILIALLAAWGGPNAARAPAPAGAPAAADSTPWRVALAGVALAAFAL